jgi:hypothetical protein
MYPPEAYKNSPKFIDEMVAEGKEQYLINNKNGDNDLLLHLDKDNCKRYGLL